MDCRPSLDAIPQEVMEAIVTLLEFRDRCNLRMIARKVTAKSSSGIFQTHFRNKKIKLNANEQLREFVYITRPDQVGCLVERLILVDLPASRDQGVRKQDSAELLTQAMKNLRLNSAPGRSLSLSLVIEREGTNGNTWPNIREALEDNTWPSTWEAAAELFQTTAQALGESELPIQILDIFGGVPRCSLACDQIATVLEKVDLSASLQGLQQLSMSLSHHQIHEPESEEMQSFTTGKKHTTAICRFLELCTALEDLQLHWYNLRTGELTDALLEEQRFFDRVAESCRFSSLSRCTLKGIYTSEATLLSFLRQIQLSSLAMEEIHLHSGKFRHVFDCLISHMEQLESVHLDDLWEPTLIHFDAPGEPHFPRSGRNGPNDLTRIGAKARKPIRYRLQQGYLRGSPKFINWIRKREFLYGPPAPHQ